jgi:acyl-CoA thioester hydrolase
MKPPENTFVARSRHRVLYADTDAMGIVYHGTYFRFFERAREEYLRQRGRPYSEMEARGLVTPLTEVGAHFYHPFRYDEVIVMECWVAAIKRASFRIEYRLYEEENPDETRVSGYTVLAAVDRASHKIIKIPDWVMEVIT